MDPVPATTPPVIKLLDGSGRPIYAVDPLRQIIYCNGALAAWLGLPVPQIVGRDVEYHSEPASDSTPGPILGLCPPPAAMAGHRSTGTVSCVDREGRLLHRRAEFLPLAATADASPGVAVQLSTAAQGGVLVILESSDLSTAELAAELSEEPTADELHRAIRRFRRTQAAEYAIETLLGDSAAMRKVRAQVAAAAASGANALVRGPRGSGRSHVARAIHYQSPDAGRLVLVDCEVVPEDLLRRRLDSLRGSDESQRRPTLLLVNLDGLSAPLASQLLHAVADSRFAARVLATACDLPDGTGAAAGQLGTRTEAAPPPDPRLLDLVSTITIRLPRLVDRSEDLPILAQSFLELCNRGSAKQVGAVQPEAVELLALYHWPSELDELRGVMTAAHAACNSHEIGVADLPAVIRHAARASSLPRREQEHIVLDEFLAAIEKELIGRALAQAGGNKTEAAKLLGMTRPRLYRRLVQLGLAAEQSPTDEPPPEIES